MTPNWITYFCVFILALVIQHTKAQECASNQAEIDGKCFQTKVNSRDRIFDFEWSYPLNLTDTSLTEDDVVNILRVKFIVMSAEFKDYDLSRSFCIDACNTLDIEVVDTLEGQLNCFFYIEDVVNLIQEGPVLTSEELLREYVRNDFFKLKIENTTYGVSGFSLDTSFYCPPGNEVVGATSFSAFCGGCLAGQYLDADTELCTLCPLGTYQEESAQTECMDCPGELSTEEEGADSQDLCIDILICDPGKYFKLGFCDSCAIGYYQPESNRDDSCLQCEEGYTTYGITTAQSDQCFQTCSAGWLLHENGTCTACPRGTYLTDPFSERECNDCPDGLTTDGEGTATEDECYNVVCLAGEEKVGSNPGVCVSCPEDTYNPVEGGECVSCGDPAEWRTGQTGATSQDQCQFYCAGGSYIIDSASPYCEDCPADTYKQPDDYYSTQCTNCPGNTPKTAGPGSDSRDDCKYARCSAGQYIESDALLTCVDCDYGFYQTDYEPISQTCAQCPDMQSTRQTGSSSKDQCEDYCASGSQLVNGECEPCAVGYYKDNGGGSVSELFSGCHLCPLEYVTEDIGTTSEDDCNIANCSQGYYLTESKSSCIKCPRGTYQDQRYQPECKPCPDPESSTPQEGSTSAQDCTVYVDRVRYALKLKFDMVWKENYYDHSSTDYQTLENRIIKQVNRTLSKIESYRQGLALNALAEGSVDAHMMAKFYSLNTNIESDLDRVLGEAIDTGTISGETVDGTASLPVDKRLPDVYEYAEKVNGVPDVCPYGNYFDYSTKQCADCSVGTYQPSGVGDICIACPDGYSTVQTGSRELTDCVLVCEAGSEADGDSCALCQKGTYKDTAGVHGCTSCGPSQTTMVKGATAETYCIASCFLGEYSNPEKICTPCPVNTYNPSLDQTTCLDCSDNYQTRTTGSRDISDCLDPCEFDEPCFNDGTCRWNSGTETYTCICTEAFDGEHCETAKDICRIADPCQNGATCDWDVKEESYSCFCPQEYKGFLCETYKNLCINEDPCLNGGTCEWDQDAEVASCSCTQEYTGDLCDLVKNVCVRDDPCQNGATCYWNEQEAAFNCTCTAEYTGDTCNLLKDQCQGNNPCKNGGSCEWDSATESASCVCTGDYIGENCDQLKATESPDNTAIYIGAGAGAGALVLVVVIVLIVCRCRRTPKQSSKPPLPSAVAITSNNNNVELGQPNKTLETTPAPPPVTTVNETPQTLPPVPNIPPPPIPESPPAVPTKHFQPEYLTPPQEARREDFNSPRSNQDAGKTVTTVAMSSSTERISHRSVQPPESPHGSPSRRHRSRSRSPKRQSRAISANRLRRLETEIPDGSTSMPPMANPLLEENLPPADYPFDPPPAGLDYPDERRAHVRWKEDGLVQEPPPYSKKDPGKKKGKHSKKRGASKGKKHVRIDTDLNVEHKLSVRSNASSHHTYMDLDGEPQIDYMQPSARTRTVPGPASRSMTFHSPIYETLN